MESNDDAVFEVKETAKPGTDSEKKTIALDDDDLDLEKPSLLKSISGIFSRKKIDDDIDINDTIEDDLPTDNDDTDDLELPEPSQSVLQKVEKKVDKAEAEDEFDLDSLKNSKGSASGKSDSTALDLDDDLPKQSFIRKIFGGLGRKTDLDDDTDLSDLKIK